MSLDTQLIKHEGELFAYLLTRTSKDYELAQDLYQDLFIKVRKTVQNGKYVEEGKCLHWLKRIARNLVIDHYRKTQKIKLLIPNEEHNIFDMLVVADDDYEDTFVSPRMKKRLKLAVETLPEAQQELINMRFYRNMSYKEIVIETGEKQANLLPRMHYAIKKLRKELCTN